MIHKKNGGGALTRSVPCPSILGVKDYCLSATPELTRVLIVPISTDSWQQLRRPIRTGTLSSVSGSPKPSFLNRMTSILCACAVSHIGLAMAATRGGSSRTRLFNTQKALELICFPEVFSGPDSVSSSDEVGDLNLPGTSDGRRRSRQNQNKPRTMHEKPAKRSRVVSDRER